MKYRREQQIKSSLDKVPQNIELCPTVRATFDQWKESPGVLALTLQDSFTLSIVDDASLCFAAYQVDGRLELLELYDTVLCLVTFFRGGPGRKFNFDLIDAQLQQRGITATPELVEQTLNEKWSSGRRLKIFCEELLGDIGTVLVLPRRIAAWVLPLFTYSKLTRDSLVKDVGPVYKSSFKLFEDCVRSLKRAGVGSVASKNRTKEIVGSFSGTLLGWTGDDLPPAAKEPFNKAASTTEKTPKRTETAPNRVTKRGSKSAAKTGAAAINTLPRQGLNISSFDSDSGLTRKKTLNEGLTSSSDRLRSDTCRQALGAQQAPQQLPHDTTLALPHSLERPNGDTAFINQSLNAEAALRQPALDFVIQDDPEAVGFVPSLSPGPLNLMGFDHNEMGSLQFVDSLLQNQLIPMGFQPTFYMPS